MTTLLRGQAGSRPAHIQPADLALQRQISPFCHHDNTVTAKITPQLADGQNLSPNAGCTPIQGHTVINGAQLSDQTPLVTLWPAVQGWVGSFREQNRCSFSCTKGPHLGPNSQVKDRNRAGTPT